MSCPTGLAFRCYFDDADFLNRIEKNSANITANTTVIVHSVVELLQSASKNATPIWSNNARIPKDIAISNTTSKIFLIIIMIYSSLVVYRLYPNSGASKPGLLLIWDIAHLIYYTIK